MGKIMLETPEQFGTLIRQRRKALRLTQEELALAVNVGPRFIAELEAGKATCQLGKALAVAHAVGVRLTDATEDPSGHPDRGS
jgi:y4mF family transcriptional regulator